MVAQPSSIPFQPYRKVQATVERDMTAILESAAKAIERRVRTLPIGIGGDVRRAQLRMTLAAVRRMQRSMWTGAIDPLVKRGVDDAEKAAESAIEAMTRVAYAALPDGAAEALVRGLRLSAESGLESDAKRRKRELSVRVFHQAALHEGKVEQLIREGLIANLSAKELAHTVYEHVSPTTKGGASYAAMRLARTEINNAFHERQLVGATRPGVRAVKWNLSGSHRVPDLCNVYASHDKGSGEWAGGQVPDKPHPQCFCYLTYITASPKEFQKRLAAGSFDDEIDKRTKANLERLGQPVSGGVVPNKRTPRKRTPAAKKPTVVPIRKEKTFAEKMRDVDKAKSEELSGGAIAMTDLLTFPDGTKAVRKLVNDEFRDAKDQQDAEELSAALARAMNISAPQVIRSREDVVLMEFMEGDVAINRWDDEDKGMRGVAKLAKQNPEFRQEAIRVGLLDLITVNSDRNLGNWLINDGKIVAIDHGMTFGELDDETDPDHTLMIDAMVQTNPFTMLFRGEPKSGELLGQSNDYSQEDLNHINKALHKLLPMFKWLGQEGWYHLAIERVEFLRPYAKGKGTLFR